MINLPNILLRKNYSKYDRFEVAEQCVIVVLNHAFTIPVGYCTDFASVPQALWSVFPPHGLAAIPALIHDYWYDNRLFEGELGEKEARRLADVCFLRLMEKTNVPKWQRLTYYYAVRWFGYSFWID